MDLTSLKNLVDAANWILTLGRSDLLKVRRDTETLIGEMRKSLDSLYDVVVQVRSIDAKKPDRATVQGVLDYVERFYLGKNDLAIARTRCSHIRRDSDRILFKLQHVLHADLGKWREADQALSMVRYVDNELSDGYEKNLVGVRDRLRTAADSLAARKRKQAADALKSLQSDLEKDFRTLVDYLAVMDKAVQKLWKISG